MNILVWAWLSCEIILIILCALQLRLAVQRYAWRNDEPSRLAFTDLPTISVCVPARNETFALTKCLESIIASDYPKLEIIVLDDCSQDTTSQLVRSFAQAGVRFIQGEAPPEGWLGRNHAIDVLSQAASGQYFVFMGVDTRLAPTTLNQLVEYSIAKRATMVSLLPIQNGQSRPVAIFSSLRYFWQIMAPQFFRTPTSTALWMVQADTFKQIGFERFKNVITPENKLAHIFAAANSYRFLIGDSTLGASYAKKWSSQIETAVRQYFPALKKNILLVVSAIAGIIVAGIGPYFGVFVFAHQPETYLLWVICLAVAISMSVLYAAYARYTTTRPWAYSLVVFPLLLVQELFCVAASAYAYLSGRVNWKGRNVCYPVLQRSGDKK